LGSVDLLVNNAAVSGPIGPIWEADPQEWWRCLEVNLRGQFYCARTVLPKMILRRRGRIINIASGAGTRPIPYMGAYVISKTALIRFSENLAAETADYGIKVFAIEPGTVQTAMTKDILGSTESQKWLEWYQNFFDQKLDIPAERAAELIFELAGGKADELSGRFISVSYDLKTLVKRADQIKDEDLYGLRLRDVKSRMR
jgi:NAD(P)-dependent dehydrogenase (short-subunit alcohol dehydrogenase family)